MNSLLRFIAMALLAALSSNLALAADQTVPGKGNANAVDIATRSPLVQSAMTFLLAQGKQINDRKLQRQTLDAIGNPQTCVTHRAGLTDSEKQQIVNTLIAQGLVNVNDAASITGGVKAGVFPPVLNDGANVPSCLSHSSQLPEAFTVAITPIRADYLCMLRIMKQRT